MVHEHLTIGVHARTDPDRRDVDRLGDHLRHPNRHAFEHDREAPGVLERLRGLHELAGLLGLLALHLEPTHGMDRLRRQADVAHHRNLRVDDLLDHRQSLATALELHRMGAGPHQLGRVAHRLLGRHVVAHPRQVADDVAVGLGPRHRSGVVDHVVDRHLEGVVVAEDDHRDRVTDEDEVGAGFARDASARGVVRGDHDERLATVTHFVRSNCRGGLAHD